MFTREYVRMCRKSKDLQVNWRPESGDWWYVGARDLICPIIYQEVGGKLQWSDIEHQYNLPRDIDLYGIVWLPRIDQLQGMIMENTTAKYDELIEGFLYFMKTLSDPAIQNPAQLWLGYYMYATQQKNWKEGRWVKETESVIEQ
ncbi:hypothetical protein KDK77_00040 [bacterium]|nr:hypothetical protein [bacterium]MCP5461609.1 hypothetical protein [bacterium]